MSGANPGIAAVLSFIFNGLGQLYNGQIKKGLVIIFLSTLSMLVLLIGAIILVYILIIAKTLLLKELIWSCVLFGLGIISICVIGIYSIFDAYNVAKKVS